MINRHIFQAGSSDWLDKRQSYITGTEVSCLFRGIGYKSSAKIMEEKLSPIQNVDSIFMRIGRILEPAVFQAFEEHLNIIVNPAIEKGKVLMLTHSEVPLSCSLDGITESGIVVEAKTAGSANLEKAKENIGKWLIEVPIHYIMQVQVQLLLTETPWAYIGCMGYHFPLPFVVYKINANKQLHGVILKAVDRFWDCFYNNREFSISQENIDKVKSLLRESTQLIFNTGL